jgi:uncharacterized SAM-binding protein YcdF (DUF218 family)
MFFLLSKLAPPLLFPPGGTIVLLLIAAALRKRKPRAAWALAAFALGTLYAFSTSALSDSLSTGLEAKYPPVTMDRVPATDAVVVLGGLLHIPATARPDTELTESSDRLWMAARLYRAGKAPLIVLAGGNIPLLGEVGMSEARAAAGLLHEWGIPKEAILLEERSQNTHENAVLSKSILDSRGAKRILLVTSAYHMPRAVAIFRRVGVDLFPVPTDYQTGWHNPDTLLGFMPAADQLALSNTMLREWLGLWVYRLRGWA